MDIFTNKKRSSTPETLKVLYLNMLGQGWRGRGVGHDVITCMTLHNWIPMIIMRWKLSATSIIVDADLIAFATNNVDKYIPEIQITLYYKIHRIIAGAQWIKRFLFYQITISANKYSTNPASWFTKTNPYDKMYTVYTYASSNYRDVMPYPLMLGHRVQCSLLIPI